MKIKAIGAALALCVGAVSVSAQAQTVLDSERPGSVVVYPLFDINNDAGNARSTTMKLSNVGDAAIWVHFVRVCAGIKSFGGEGLCQASNRQAKLTPKETFVRDVANWFSIDRDACPTGYIVAYVQQSEVDKTPINSNNLIGSLHMNSAGSLNQRTAGMQAYGFQGLGAPGTPLGGNSGGGFQPTLAFDGANLAAPPTTHWTDYLATVGQRNSVLTLLTLDIAAGAQNFPTLVALDAWNQGEEYYSGAIEYVCHVHVRLDDEVNAKQPGAGVQGGLAFGKASNLGSSYGLLQMTPLDTANATGHAIMGAISEFGQNRHTLRGLWHDDEPRPTEWKGR
jgi:hypothetical protein